MRQRELFDGNRTIDVIVRETTMLRRALVILTCLVLLGACASGPHHRATVLYEGARLIPGDGTAPVENAAFIVESGIITRIGRSGELALPAGSRRVDLTGKTVMPTLISTHVHPGFQRDLTYAGENYTYDNIVADLERALYFGVGTVMSQGIEKGDLTYRVRADQQAGRVGGARLKIAGRGIGAPNAGPGAPAYANIAYEVTSETEIRTAVRELAASKVDAIKIWVDDRGGRAPRLAPELFRAAIDEGHRHKLRVAAHVFYHADAVDLADAGIDSFAHLVRDKIMDDQLIALVVKRNVYVMPNLGGAERNRHRTSPPWMEEPYLAGMLADTVAPPVIARMRASFAGRDAAAAERAAQGYAILERSLARLDTAGVRIILGCDTGLPDHFFGYAEQKELELMVAAGMSPMNVIVAATGRAAEYLGVVDGGTLARGKRADFLVLDGNPLADIRNTRRIVAIYVGGAMVDRAALRRSLQKTN